MIKIRILKIVLRTDGKYDCEAGIVDSNKNQKIVFTLEDEDLSQITKRIQMQAQQYSSEINYYEGLGNDNGRK